jgi:hypothetical protein
VGQTWSRSSSHDDEQQNMSDKPKDAYGYVPATGEILIRSDEIACILVLRDERPINHLSRWQGRAFHRQRSTGIAPPRL